jgi:hypothetical protein
MPVGMWTPGADVAKRARDPTEGARARVRAGNDTKDSEGERSSREDEPGFSRRRGTTVARKTIAVRRKRRGNDGSGSTRSIRYVDSYNTLQGSQLHERLRWSGDGPALTVEVLHLRRGHTTSSGRLIEPPDPKKPADSARSSWGLELRKQ